MEKVGDRKIINKISWKEKKRNYIISLHIESTDSMITSLVSPLHEKSDTPNSGKKKLRKEKKRKKPGSLLSW